MIRAAQAHSTVLELAAAAGAALHHGEAVVAIEPDASGVTVTTRRHRYRCETAVVAAGPWSRSLLAQAGIDLAARVSAQTIAYLSLRDGVRRPSALIDFDGDEPYALFDPRYGLKVALHARGLDAGRRRRTAGGRFDGRRGGRTLGAPGIPGHRRGERRSRSLLLHAHRRASAS